MAEKRVSVRLSATGGRQVRAELEGVGEAGSRGFGRLSREMELANTRMAAFARRARIAATAAATALAGAVVAMTRSTVAAANEIGQLSQVANANPEVFQRWSAASATVGIEQEKLADILKDVNDRVGDFLQTGGGPMADFFENIAPRVGVTADPDGALIAWMDHEEALFRHLEREIVSDRLKAGFMEAGTADVEGFLSFSLSVQNRRKSRAGLAFGHHVEAILQAHEISYTREATTEKRNAADFLFPGEDEYADRRHSDDQLAMLAVKTSCKDRWRQVLAEADRIRTKHLLTLEPAISKIQTAEMQSQGLQLVLPASLHSTYQVDQRAWLMGVGDFLGVVRDLHGRQRLLI